MGSVGMALYWSVIMMGGNWYRRQSCGFTSWATKDRGYKWLKWVAFAGGLDSAWWGIQVSWKNLGRTSALLKGANWGSGCHTVEVCGHVQMGRRLQRIHRTLKGDYVWHLAWDCLGTHQEHQEFKDVAGEKDVWAKSLRPSPVTWTMLSGGKIDDTLKQMIESSVQVENGWNKT